MRQEREMIPLVDAARQLGRSYNQTLRLLLIHELRGERNDAGRWEVDRSDVERLAREWAAAEDPVSRQQEPRG